MQIKFEGTRSQFSRTPETQIAQVAQELEVTFLAEMLKSMGTSKSGGSFGGGQGEAQFNSFLREAQARQIFQAGGLGLAKHFEASLEAK